MALPNKRELVLRHRDGSPACKGATVDDHRDRLTCLVCTRAIAFDYWIVGPDGKRVGDLVRGALTTQCACDTY